MSPCLLCVLQRYCSHDIKMRRVRLVVNAGLQNGVESVSNPKWTPRTNERTDGRTDRQILPPSLGFGTNECDGKLIFLFREENFCFKMTVQKVFLLSFSSSCLSGRLGFSFSLPTKAIQAQPFFLFVLWKLFYPSSFFLSFFLPLVYEQWPK